MRAFSTGYASELMQIADGRKTVAALRGRAKDGMQQTRVRNVTNKSSQSKIFHVGIFPSRFETPPDCA